MLVLSFQSLLLLSTTKKAIEQEGKDFPAPVTLFKSYLSLCPQELKPLCPLIPVTTACVLVACRKLEKVPAPCLPSIFRRTSCLFLVYVHLLLFLAQHFCLPFKAAFFAMTTAIGSLYRRWQPYLDLCSIQYWYN